MKEFLLRKNDKKQKTGKEKIKAGRGGTHL